jgi:hypothetical protein
VARAAAKADHAGLDTLPKKRGISRANRYLVAGSIPES